MPDNKDLKVEIQTALSAFEKKPLADAARGLLNVLGYRSNKTLKITPNTPKQFQVMFDPHKEMKSDAKLDEWTSVDLLFQVTGDELREAFSSQPSFLTEHRFEEVVIESYLFFAIELSGKTYSRKDLAGITREVNKCFKMPALIIFKHSETLTFSIIARRVSKRDESKDVLQKVTLIKDIRSSGNRAHVEILHDLALSQLAQANNVSNFVELQKAWEKTLDLNELNKKFYKEIANWYFWAIKTVKFPKDAGSNEEERNATSVIRLITRLIFVWFIKEKGLVPDELFDPRHLKEMLNFSDAKNSTYYKAILQNLFFATLNTEMGKDRIFRRENSKGLDPDYLMSNFYRYKNYFKNPDQALKLFAGIPFLNGGLFECLDKEIEKGKVIRVDGFSNRDDNPLQVPDDLFLMEKEKQIDLNDIFVTKNKRYSVRGLIHIFNSYKFTIEENTPIEEEIALDPELLGKVFENLLAAYNPETGTTARKQTGSFYTPREIVNYMVDEALIAYLESKLQDTRDSQAKLRQLLSYNTEQSQFSETETVQLIHAIDSVKVIDPACGSGAFPMGALHKLVFMLEKLDPKNERWQMKQIDKAQEILDSVARNAAIQSIEQVFTENHDDYGRKLYLIENCIYGVDIQPIAVQIAKLRFFISLVVDQKTDSKKYNLGIRPLPNLETKFVAANTLIGIQKPKTGKVTALSFGDVLYRDKQVELKEVRKQHFSARTATTKRKYRDLDKKLRAEISGMLRKDGWGSATAQQLASWDPYDQNAHADFFDPEWMFGIEGGFDVVIGNPPYMRVQGLQQTQAEYMDFYREYFQSAKGGFDLYALFIERGYQLLDKRGQFAFIVPHKFFQANFGEALRRYLTKRRALRQIVRFGSEQVFEEATTYTCLLFLSATPLNEFDLLEVKTLVRGEEVLQAARYRVDHPDYAYARISAPVSTTGKLDWDFAIGEQSKILRRMQQHPRTLGGITRKIFVGLQTSADRIYVLEILKQGESTILCYSKQLNENVEIERGLVKPFLMGKDVHRYEPVIEKNVVIFPYTVTNDKAELMSQKYIKQNFPLGWKYLTRNQHDLCQRENGRMRNEEFYAYIYPKNLTEFQAIKLMTPDICGRPEMSIDLSGRLYHTTTIYSFAFKPELQKSPKFFLGLFNSKVMWYFLSLTGSLLRGNYVRFKTEYLKPFPIADSSHEQERVIETLVDYVLYLKAFDEPKEIKAASDVRVMTAYFEQLIDLVVYEIYFPEEFGDVNRVPSQSLTPELLPSINDLRFNKMDSLKKVFEKIYDTKHPVRSLVFFLDTLETVRVIELKSKTS